jgi:RNA-binding protein 25
MQADDAQMQQSKSKVDALVAEINRTSLDAASNGLIDKEKYVIPPHLHDLQEADLPETQRGLVISEIAQFRERAAKREREKMRDATAGLGSVTQGMGVGGGSVVGAPSGPKVREWGKPQHQQQQQMPERDRGYGKGAQGYGKPVGFVKAEDAGAATGSLGDERSLAGKGGKTDEELESDRKENRRKDEESSFRDVSVSSLHIGLDANDITARTTV